MRHRADHNQAEIVEALRAIGCSVYHIGRPVDLVVGYQARTYLVCVKNPKGLNKITKFQEKFFREWKGQVGIVRSPEEATQLVTESYKGERVSKPIAAQ